ncbi:uncharacterized protein LOC122047291 isoform X2 [Zingiber officinale]|uniref:uncharacterized protein LOC122047291 isoform X2 n=1 Tax=Zingiber officinale TaxID=94328 RepID=UPI001C4D8DD3|nr:uncharacterized protein LOC122047291 isoform X2 [Zingiber officinale]
MVLLGALDVLNVRLLDSSHYLYSLPYIPIQQTNKKKACSNDPQDENDVGCYKGRFCRKRMVILAGKKFEGDCVEGNRTSNQKSCSCYWNYQGKEERKRMRMKLGMMICIVLFFFALDVLLDLLFGL